MGDGRSRWRRSAVSVGRQSPTVEVEVDVRGTNYGVEKPGMLVMLGRINIGTSKDRFVGG